MKQIYFSILFIVLLVSPVLAQGCGDEGFFGTFGQNKQVVITETCPTCTFINITIKNPDSKKVVENTPMIFANGIFTYVFNSATGDIGTYFVEGFSNLDLPVKGCFDITPTGTAGDNLWLNFVMIFSLAVGSYILIYVFNESRATVKHGDNNFVYYYLGAFMLFAIGIYVIITGFAGYKNILTEAFGWITWGSALFFLTRPYFVGGKWQW